MNKNDMPAKGGSAFGGKLIIGLGNPGSKYKKTWHNLGFLVLDNIKNEFDFANFKKQSKLQAEITTGSIGAEKVILAKPINYMNNSGHAVSLLMKYYKIDINNLIVIHDDIDLDLERIKITNDSSAGGHNGVKSIIESIKTQTFIRLRIGVKTPKLEKMDAAKYVLEKYNLFQTGKIKEVIKKATSAIETTLTDSLESVMNNYN